MKIEINRRFVYGALCVILAIFFFIPIFKLDLLGINLYRISVYDIATGGSWATKSKAYGWILLIIPAILFVLPFIKTRRKSKDIATLILCGIALLMIWILGSDRKIMITGVICIVIYIATAIAELIQTYE